ncbi:ribosomal protein S18-alanine N-acetyltransferase [Anaeromyxobacter diazotrophicus]|uniref:Ribosomal-protein-alanine N-acetyltransferase RimI n=1 Tax=Anaeromyxobacter diazotrophicus TaxID=2590199 RepID=A0A7I9VNS5_9BACT|nr:ribosomal protein S18-alanine N-acetyltransferase [Anaeromyxobacter diazotrophicus]GEJ58066.1 ribosomal-protein-alanine N-acetyltransferase RimI [Anaeromyxobacter diazotrophicus]
MRRPVEPDRPAAPLAPAPFAFRRMALDDLARVMEIEKDGFAHPWSADLLRREMVHDWSTILLATELRDGRAGVAREAILGFIVFWLVHDELHVLNIATALEARRRGVGRALMDEAAQRARRGGAVLATLEVRRSNASAIALYRALGYRQVGIRPNYYADEGEDAIVMLLDL